MTDLPSGSLGAALPGTSCQVELSGEAGRRSEAASLGSLAGAAPGTGAGTADRGVGEGQSQEILKASLVMYTVPEPAGKRRNNYGDS